MKRLINTFRLPVVGLAVLALTACENDANEHSSDGRTALVVSSTTIAGQPATRATDTAWEAGDAIGITMFEAGTSTLVPANPVAGKYTTADGKGAFAPADKDNTLYYPTQNKKADIVAFYPYAPLTGEAVVPVSVASQTKLSAIDLMVADKLTDKSATDDAVTLTFRHKLVKLDITVDKEDTAAGIDLSKAVVSISGAPLKASWNLAAEALTVDAASKASVELPATYTAATDRLSAEAILLPGAAEGVKILITASGATFAAALPGDLKAGTKNSLRIHLKMTGVKVEAAVTDWTTGVAAERSVRFEGILPGDVQLTANEGDQLAISYAKDNLKGLYTYASGAWTSSKPLFWDDIAQQGYTGEFAAEYTFATKTTPVEDKLVGTATNVAYGGTMSLALAHTTAKLSFTFEGDGTTTTDDEVATFEKSLTLGSNTYTIPDGSMNVAPATLAATDVITLTRPNGNTYAVKLSELQVESGKMTDESTGRTSTLSSIEAGTHYILTLTVSETSVGISASIADWTEVNGSGTMTPEFE